MDHAAHEPGTVEGCPECRRLAYEPGWYGAISRERPREPAALEIPEVDTLELEIVLPDLEATRPDDDER